MEKGEITQEGTYEELLQFGTAFEQLVNAHQDSKTTLDSNVAKEGAMIQYQQPMIQQQGSEAEISTGNLPSVQLTQEEERELGGAGLKTYKDHVSVSKGWFLLVLIILTQCVFVALQYLATYWLAATIQSHRFSVGIVVGVYAVMTTASCLFAYVRSLVAAHFGLKASREFFSGFMDSVFKAPMLFFDSTPTGRIMTRVCIYCTTFSVILMPMLLQICTINFAFYAGFVGFVHLGLRHPVYDDLCDIRHG